jgi:DNA-binding LytR/AlgR family response regulator
VGKFSVTREGAVRILIVEDEPLTAMDLQGLLNELGYENISHAESISRALELIETINPDFAFLDVNIGRDTVFAVAATLVARKVPFVFVTGVSWENLPAEWRRYPVLAKPLMRAALDAAMHGVKLWTFATVAPPARVASVQPRTAPEKVENTPSQVTLGFSCEADPLKPTKASGEEAREPPGSD